MSKSQFAQLCSAFGLAQIKILPWHSFGSSKEWPAFCSLSLCLCIVIAHNDQPPFFKNIQGVADKSSHVTNMLKAWTPAYCSGLWKKRNYLLIAVDFKREGSKWLLAYSTWLWKKGNDNNNLTLYFPMKHGMWLQVISSDFKWFQETW